MPTNQLLVFSRTEGFRHESIPQAIDTIRSFGYNATFTEDPSPFSTHASLAQYNAIVFLSTTGEVLNADQKGNLEVWLSRGGGLVGVHSATSSFITTPYFKNALGASFSRHPECQNATFTVLNSNHPSTANIPTRWRFSEEVYNFDSDPRRTNASVLVSVDEYSYNDQFKPLPGNAQGSPHPIAWYRDGQAIRRANMAQPWTSISNTSWDSSGLFRPPGRVFYTGLGHRTETWLDENFQSHIQGGIDWVLQINTTKPKTGISSTSGGLVNSTSKNGIAADGEKSPTSDEDDAKSAATLDATVSKTTNILQMGMFTLVLSSLLAQVAFQGL